MMTASGYAADVGLGFFRFLTNGFHVLIAEFFDYHEEHVAPHHEA
jgi:hypothetical protein